jgi:hypothetical protein
VILDHGLYVPRHALERFIERVRPDLAGADCIQAHAELRAMLDAGYEHEGLPPWAGERNYSSTTSFVECELGRVAFIVRREPLRNSGRLLRIVRTVLIRPEDWRDRIVLRRVDA